MAFVSLQPTPVSAALKSNLAIVVPIYNEADTIRDVVAEWATVLDRLGADYQWLLVNDGSRDRTVEVLAAMEQAQPDRIVVVDKPNSGHGRTCRLGYDAAVNSPCVEWILQIDSDGQCDPAYFPEFWSARAEADCIFGRRVRRDDGLARALTSKVCKIGATLLGGHDMVDPNVPYRLMRREVLAIALADVPQSFNIHNVALTFVLKKAAALRWRHVPIHFRDRQGGSNSINLLSVGQWGVDMLLELGKLNARLKKN
jgi:glycosyltransferase involved in cell wall biosynthesis